LKKVAKWKSVTLDDVRFTPMANIELAEEISHALSYGAEGIGLFRSEFIYLQRSTLPTEEDHYQVYARLAKEAHPYPVYIRTIDVIASEIDEVVCPLQPDRLRAVGEWYVDFAQVSDEAVLGLLGRR
ncbi:MAG: putative PEP-binding protein, partial [Actinomycetota bacterium]